MLMRRDQSVEFRAIFKTAIHALPVERYYRMSSVADKPDFAIERPRKHLHQKQWRGRLLHEDLNGIFQIVHRVTEFRRKERCNCRTLLQ